MSTRRARKRKAERLARAGYVKTRNPLAYDHAHGPRLKGGPHGGDRRAQHRRQRRQTRLEARWAREE